MLSIICDRLSLSFSLALEFESNFAVGCNCRQPFAVEVNGEGQFTMDYWALLYVSLTRIGDARIAIDPTKLFCLVVGAIVRSIIGGTTTTFGIPLPAVPK